VRAWVARLASSGNHVDQPALITIVWRGVKDSRWKSSSPAADIGFKVDVVVTSRLLTTVSRALSIRARCDQARCAPGDRSHYLPLGGPRSVVPEWGKVFECLVSSCTGVSTRILLNSCSWLERPTL